MGSHAPQLLMRLFSYIIARDFGFAPNPFHGWCSLATCKPRIRAAAAVGDWVLGTGAKTNYGLSGTLVFAMLVEETLDFDAYWLDPRFLCKRPVLNGSLKQLYGDNIYHRRGKRWIQEDSHHSLEGGRPNPKNLVPDTKVNRVLLARRFAYFGASALPIPSRFRPDPATRRDVCCSRHGHQMFSDRLADDVVEWLQETDRWGLQGMPLEFPNHPRASA